MLSKPRLSTVSNVDWTNVQVGAFKATASTARHHQSQSQSQKTAAAAVVRSFTAQCSEPVQLVLISVFNVFCVCRFLPLYALRLYASLQVFVNNFRSTSGTASRCTRFNLNAIFPSPRGLDRERSTYRKFFGLDL